MMISTHFVLFAVLGSVIKCPLVECCFRLKGGYPVMLPEAAHCSWWL